MTESAEPRTPDEEAALRALAARHWRRSTRVTWGRWPF